MIADLEQEVSNNNVQTDSKGTPAQCCIACVSLAELDPAFANSNVLVVDTPNSPPSSYADLLLIVGTGKVTLRTVQHLTTIRVRRLR